MTRKLELFLAPGETYAGPGDVAGVVAALSGERSDGSSVRAAVHDPAILGGLAHGEETATAPAFVALLEVRFGAAVGDDDLLDRLAAALGASPAFDLAGSTAVAGTEHVIVDGDEPLMLAMALRRRPEMSRTEFGDYWLSHHAELGRQVPGSQGYRQLHRDDALSERVVATLGLGGPEFDGVALAYYSSDERFRAIMANAEIVDRLLEDERRFIDHSQAAMVVGRS